jgi:hypothetical protein
MIDGIPVALGTALFGTSVPQADAFGLVDTYGLKTVVDDGIVPVTSTRHMARLRSNLAFL